MINIQDKVKCDGCGACFQRCPQHCISMTPDEQGFLYPIVDKEKCIGCDLCDRVCPFNDTMAKRIPLELYASRSKDEEFVRNSSSGGIFSELAKQILQRDGIVFGAAFDEEFKVTQSYIDDINDLHLIQGSKYVQSKTLDTFRQVEQFLKDNKDVLYCGTPCIISGLLHYLKKPYANLYCVDFVCHGVPSPKVWNSYLETIRQTKATTVNTQIADISFRDKGTGWKCFSLLIKGKSSNSTEPWGGEILVNQPLTENIYLNGFIGNMFLRPSCYQCNFKSFKSGSDITLADCWGIEHIYPQISDNKGESIVAVNTEKGYSLFDTIDCKKLHLKYEDALKYNPSIEKSVELKKSSSIFWKHFNESGIWAVNIAKKEMAPSIIRRIMIRFKSILTRL